MRLNDRGVRRRPRNLSGTGEFDYFANPFSFTPLRGFEEGGKVDLEPRGMFRGGRAAIEAREGSGVENVGFNPDTFDPFEGQFAPSDFIIPSYFSNPFGSPTTDASGGLDRGLTDAQGNRQFNIVEDTLMAIVELFPIFSRMKIKKGETLVPVKINQYLMCFGVLLYAGVGIVSIFLNGNYLDYNVLASDRSSGQHIGIILVELGVGITVATVMIALYHSFASFRIKDD